MTRFEIFLPSTRQSRFLFLLTPRRSGYRVTSKTRKPPQTPPSHPKQFLSHSTIAAEQPVKPSISMAPLTPHWARPSHPEIQEVLVSSPTEFTTRSISRVSLPPYGLFAKMSFPPCTVAEKPTYATVQMGRDEHLNLNSDLVYINHSCEPSLVSAPLKFNLGSPPCLSMQRKHPA